MIDGLTSAPFSATNMPPIAQPTVHYVDEIIAASREQFARSRAEVEEGIVKFHEPTPKTPAAAKPASAPKAPVAAAPKKAEMPVAPKAVVVPKAVTAPPAPAAKPPVHQPFKVAFKAVPQDVTLASLGQSDKKVDTFAYTAKQSPPLPQAAKPATPVSALLPLSSLNKTRPAPKVDPKVPTAENVNQLKNALAAALNKHKNSAAPEAPKAAPASVPQTFPKGTSHITKETSSTPKEVPEDVLKKILKID